jgi:RimJ/RimL family protein N-acetyltransferase/MOSC domain-containing protein YiiM
MTTVTLRLARPDDAALLHRWRTEPSVSEFQPIMPISLEEVRDLLVQRSFGTIGPNAHGDFQWLIVAGDEPVGWISLKISQLDRLHGKGTIGYTIGEAHRQKGYGRSGLCALLPIALGRKGFNLERLEAIAAVSNVASRRVLEANGFQFEGIQRGLLVIKGQRVDHAMYGLLRTDWESKSPESVMTGRVVGLFTTASEGEPMTAHERINAIAGKGLEGDRYANGTGFYSARPLPGGARELTLIEIEALAEIESESGIRLEPVESRRNVATRGIHLHALVGKRFTIGDVLCEGVRDCPPCEHLEELTGKTVMKPMARRGGLRANILSNGEIAIGDRIVEVMK